MAEISLRSYLRKIESLNQEEAFEEAIAHSRRILEYYPRNAMAYRLLGQALVRQSRWHEAAEIFRRLLSAVPNDFVAHEQLSVVYERLKQPDQAIFHLERAFEAQPNNKTVINRLRELYATYRGIQVEKVQLTAGALAGQYINRGMNEQAITVLQAALQRTPERPDLKLQLARALWNVGQSVDAAEVAIEVLGDFPYALPANRILTELWLQEQRPSDAQRYLSRIEDVDPYLAIRIATGENVAPETFMLPELDYAEYAREVLSAQRPDWLESLEAETPAADDAVADAAGWLPDFENMPEAPAAPRHVTETLSNLLPETDSVAVDSTLLPDEMPSDILRRIDAFKNSSEDATVAAPLPPDLSNLGSSDADDDADAWMSELGIEADDVPAPSRRTGLTGRLTLMEAQAEEPEEDDSWLMDLPDFVEETASSESASDDDFFAAAGLQELEAMADNAESAPVSTGLTDLLGAIDEDGDALDFDDDDLEWLTGDVDDEEVIPPPIESRVAGDSSDAFAWMRDSGIEIDENAPEPNLLTDFEAEFEDSSFNLEAASPTDWLRASGIEYEEDPLPEIELTADEMADDDENPLAWLEDSEEALIEDGAASEPAPPPKRQPAASHPVPPPPPVEPASLVDDSALEEMLELESLLSAGDYLSDTAADPADMEPPAEPVDWQETMPDDTPNWQPEDNDDSDLESMDWFSDEELLPDTDSEDIEPLDFFAEEDAMPEAENESQPAAAMPDFFADDDDSELEADNMAWLTDDELLLEEETDEQPPVHAEDDFFAENAPMADEMDAISEEGELEADSMAWLSGDLLADEQEMADEMDAISEEGELEADSMAWLSGDLLADEQEIAESSTASTLQTDLFAGDSPEFTENEEAAAPDFLPVDTTAAMDSAEDVELEADSMAWLAEGDLLGEDEMAEIEAIPFASAEDERDALSFSDEAPLDADEMATFATASDWLDDAGLTDADLLDEMASDEFDGADVDLSDEVAAGWLDASASGVPEAEIAPPAVGDMTTEWDVDDDMDMGFDWDKFDDETDSVESTADEDEVAYAVSDEDAAFLMADDEDAFAWDESEDAFAVAADEPDWLSELGSDEQSASEADQFVPLEVQTPMDWQGDDADVDDDFMSDDFALEEDAAADEVDLEQDLDWMVDADIEDTYPWDDAEELAPSPTASMTNMLNNLEANRYDNAESDAMAWSAALEDSDDDLTLEETPDWLNVVGDESGDDELAFAAQVDDELSDDAEFADMSDAEFAISEEEVGWLADLDGAYDDDASLTEEPSEFEWQPEAELTDEDFAVAEDADWLAEIEPADEADEFEPTPAPLWDEASEEAAFEWQPQTELTDEDFAAVAEADWLAAVEQADEFAVPLLEPAAEDETAIRVLAAEPQLESDAGPDWLSILGETDDAAQRTPMFASTEEDEILPAATLADEPEMGYSSDEYEEEIAAIPASNAPDWLNAMVPGLDLDYEASGEDALAAPDVAPEVVTAANRGPAEFAWLQAIVDEETGTMESVMETPPPPPQERPSSIARFVFSRLPAWLRPSENAVPVATPTVGAVAAPDYLDFEEFDREFNEDTAEDQFADVDDFEFDDFEFDDFADDSNK